MIRRMSLFALAWACATGLCHGHGLAAERVEGGVGVRVVYDDGTPVTFSDVKVRAPGAGEREALGGTTDRNGCFMFRPDAPGVWTVTVDDGMGHALTHEIAFDGALAVPAPSRGGPPKGQGVMTGLAVIFGLFGWTAYLRLQRASRGAR